MAKKNNNLPTDVAARWGDWDVCNPREKTPTCCMCYGSCEGRFVKYSPEYYDPDVVYLCATCLKLLSETANPLPSGCPLGVATE